MKRILLFGAGVGAREVLRIIWAINRVSPTWNVLGFVDKSSAGGSVQLDGLPVFSPEQIKYEENLFAVCPIYDPEIRKNVVTTEIEGLGLPLASIVDPNLQLPDDMQIGAGTMLYGGSQVSFNVRLGKCSLVFFNTLLGHDLTAGDYVTVCPSATLNGNICLEEGVFIGASATLYQGVTVGSWSSVGIGTTVLKDVPEGKKVMSMPRQVVLDKA